VLEWSIDSAGYVARNAVDWFFQTEKSFVFSCIDDQPNWIINDLHQRISVSPIVLSWSSSKLSHWIRLSAIN
jgi:hypothetical protein